MSALVLVAACSGAATSGGPPTGTPERPTGTATSTPSPPTSTPAGEDDGVLVLVSRPSGPVELRRVSRADRASSLVRELAPPTDDARVVDVAVGPGAEPLVCATWHAGQGQLHEGGATSLHCYEWPSVQGRAVEGVDRPEEVAVGPGGRLAWSRASAGDENPVFSTGTLRGAGVVAVDRWRGDASLPEDGFSGVGVQDLAWSDEGHAVVSTSVMADPDSDDPPPLLHVDLGRAARQGWLADGFTVPSRSLPPRYEALDSVRSATAGTALARTWGDSTSEADPPDRAVRVDLATGDVLQTVATVADGRILVSVSGNPDAVVYVTGEAAAEGPVEVTAYLRLEGEPRGTPITGLPEDAVDVLAQG